MWGVDKLNTETKHECLSRFSKIPLPSNLWRQGELVKRLEVPRSFLITDTVYLGDFGLAAKAGTEVRHKLPRRDIFSHAPERFHNANPSFVSDMWSYMCLFIELYLGFIPWETCQFPDYFTMINRMVSTLGPLPKQWKGCYSGYGTSENSWYDQRRKPKREDTLESIIKRNRPDLGSVELNHLLTITSCGRGGGGAAAPTTLPVACCQLEG